MTTRAELADIERRMKAVVSGFQKKDRKAILRKGAREVVLAARATTAFKDRTGTLRKSLNRVPGLRRSFDEFVGPLRGKNRRYDGYYAQMVFRSAANFKRRVLDPAARKAAPRALALMKLEAQRKIRAHAARQKLN